MQRLDEAKICLEKMAALNNREFIWEESMFKKAKKVDSAAIEEDPSKS
jgi:hypothetical protein